MNRWTKKNWFFSRLTEYNLKSKPKKCHYFQCSVVFLGYVLSPDDISANPKSRHIEELASANECKRTSLIFGVGILLPQPHSQIAAIANFLHNLVGPTNVKRKTEEGTRGND